MANAFISEVSGSGYGENLDDEYIEITILKTETLSDYTLGFYNSSGALEQWSGPADGEDPGTSFFVGQPEITLQQIFTATGGIGSVTSTVGGLNLSVIEHPNNPDYYIITVPTSISAGTTVASLEAVSLYNTAEGASYGAIRVGNQSQVTFTDGVASGTTTSGPTTGWTGADRAFDQNGNTVSTGYDNRTVGNSTVPTYVPVPPICFTSGSLFETEAGAKRADELEIGDKVQTLDHGYQSIRFIYRRKMRAIGAAAPVVFAKGTIGNTSEMIVSQKHRIYTKDLQVNSLATFQDHLIEAYELVNNSTIKIAHHLEEVEYFHIMFDKHEIVKVDGAYSESWQPHKRNLKRDKALKEELLAIFPEIADRNGHVDGSPVRTTITYNRQA